MRQGDQVLITALQPMANRGKSYVLQTTARSKLATDMLCPAPPAKRQKGAFEASACPSYDNLQETRITRKLYDVISYEGVVTHASRREIVLDRLVRLPLSRELGSTLHLFEIGNRLVVSCVFAVPGLRASLAIIPTVRTIIRLLHVGGGSHVSLDQLPASENLNLPNIKSRDRFISMYSQNCLSKKLHQLLASLQPDSADSQARFSHDLELLISGSDGCGGVVRLLHKSCDLRDSKDAFVEILANFINPISSFEKAIPIFIPHLEEIRDSCLKASYDVCTDNASCIELYQGYPHGSLSGGQTFKFSWTDSTVPTNFFSRKPECLLVGLLRSTKYINVYTLSDNSGAVSLRCYDRIPLEVMGAIVTLRRYRIIANSWNRDILIVCKANDIQRLVNGPNLASPAKNENCHSAPRSSNEIADQRREFRVSPCLRRLETVTQYCHIADQTSLACLVVQKTFPRKSPPCVVALVVAKKPRGNPWLYCADGACSGEVGVSLSDTFSGRLAGMLIRGDLFVVSYVSMRNRDRNGKTAPQRRDGKRGPEVMWTLNAKYPFVKVLDEQSEAMEVVPAWVMTRIRDDNDLQCLMNAYRETREGRVCDPLWMAYDAVEAAGSEVVSIAGTVEDTVSENQSHGPIVQLRDSVLGVVGAEIVLDRGTSLAGVCRGLQVRVVAVQRRARHRAGVAFTWTDETMIELVESEASGWKRNGDVTMESVGKWFSYSCFAAGGAEQKRDAWAPRIANVRYRRMIGFAEGGFGGDYESGSWLDTEVRGERQADVVMRVDDGTREFDLVISRDLEERLGKSATVGGAKAPPVEGHTTDMTASVGGGAVPVLYQLCEERDGGDLFADEEMNGAFECVQLRRHVNLWTCVARPEVRTRQLFCEARGRRSPLSMVRYIVSLLENGE